MKSRLSMRAQKYFFFVLRNEIHRLAYLRVYYPVKPTRSGTLRVNQNREYTFEGRVVNVESIDRKVIFFGTGSDTRILEVPFHTSDI